MTATTADYHIDLSEALRAAAVRLVNSPPPAHKAAAEAITQLWQRQHGTLTAHQLTTICHAAHSASCTTEVSAVPDVIDDDHIARVRTSLMRALADALAFSDLAVEHLAALRGQLCDPDLADSRDGNDLTAHLDTSIRAVRAAYAVLHAIITD